MNKKTTITVLLSTIFTLLLSLPLTATLNQAQSPDTKPPTPPTPPTENPTPPKVPAPEPPPEQPPTPPIAFYPPTQIATLQDDNVKESSGLVLSRKNKNILFTINDSGSKPILYAYDLNGILRGEFDIRTAKNKDWESLATLNFNNEPHILVADVGDNDQKRKDVELYLIKEPTPPAKLLKGVIKIKLESKMKITYEDGPQNCEAVAVDNTTNEILFISKIYGPKCAVYTLPTKLFALPSSINYMKRENKDIVHKAKRIATINVNVATGADITEDGKHLVICTYVGGYVYTRKSKESWADALKREPTLFPLPLRKQGETIAFSPDAKSLYLTSEKLPVPVWQLKRKETTPPSPSPPPP